MTSADISRNPSQSYVLPTDTVMIYGHVIMKPGFEFVIGFIDHSMYNHS
jgi:hypothetical protein